jgi:serine/threonine protein kinase
VSLPSNEALERLMDLIERLEAVSPGQREAEISRESKLGSKEHANLARLHFRLPAIASGDACEAGGASPPVPDLGSTKFRLEAKVGEGGMGIVYLATDLELEREVALKVTREASAAASARLESRFLNEARITGRLEHPGIVPVHELGRAPDGRAFFSMKFVRGKTLRELFTERRDDPRPLASLLETFLKVCDTVAFAHARGVVHRDLKPDNLMVGEFGEVYVLDWGLAKRLGSTEGETGGSSPSPSSRHSVVGDALGTPGFMAPEQERGEIDAMGPWTDVYGLGCILFWWLHGHPPGGALRTAPVAPIRGIPRELAAIAEKALTKDWRNRYAEAGALADDIRAFVSGERGVAWHDGPLQLIAKWGRRHPRTIASLAVALLVVPPFATLAAWQYTKSAALELQRRDEDWFQGLRRLPLAFHGSFQEREPLGGPSALAPILQALRAELRLRADSLEHDCETIAALGASRPDLHRSVLDTLYSLALELERTGVAAAALALEGRAITWSASHTVMQQEGLFAATEDEIALWEGVNVLLERAETDPWRIERWHKYLEWLREDEDTFERPIDVPALAERLDPSQLEWFGELILHVREDREPFRMMLEVVERDPSRFWAQARLAVLSENFPGTPVAGPPPYVQRAEWHYKQALALRPGTAWLHLGVARVEARLGFTSEALKNVSRGLALANTDPWLCFESGVLLESLQSSALLPDGVAVGADELFESAARSLAEPRLAANAWQRRASLSRSLGRATQASEFLGRATAMRRDALHRTQSRLQRALLLRDVRTLLGEENEGEERALLGADLLAQSGQREEPWPDLRSATKELVISTDCEARWGTDDAGATLRFWNLTQPSVEGGFAWGFVWPLDPSWDAQRDGALGTLEGEWRNRPLLGEAQGLWLVLRQSGRTYIHRRHTTTGSGHEWRLTRSMPFEERDFVEVDPHALAERSHRLHGHSNPDFSRAGEPITVGFVVVNGRSPEVEGEYQSFRLVLTPDQER